MCVGPIQVDCRRATPYTFVIYGRPGFSGTVRVLNYSSNDKQTSRNSLLRFTTAAAGWLAAAAANVDDAKVVRGGSAWKHVQYINNNSRCT